jgi:putative PIN family toxin of toxin-antitoxin system
LDTNTLFRGLANRQSASGRILRACESRQTILLLSRSVLSEYRTVLCDEQIVGRHDITPRAVELVLRRLRYIGDYLGQVRVRFRFQRDPNDEKFIELAIGGKATHIATCDHDLLSLPSAHTDWGKRFRQRLPAVNVLGPADFMRELESAQTMR